MDNIVSITRSGACFILLMLCAYIRVVFIFLCLAMLWASCIVAPPNSDNVTAVCLKLWAVILSLSIPAFLRLSFTIRLILLVVNLPPSFLLLWLVNNGSVSFVLPLALIYSLIGFKLASVSSTKSSLLSLPLPWIYRRASPPC